MMSSVASTKVLIVAVLGGYLMLERSQLTGIDHPSDCLQVLVQSKATLSMGNQIKST
jgi:hypothetical protein